MSLEVHSFYIIQRTLNHFKMLNKHVLQHSIFKHFIFFDIMIDIPLISKTFWSQTDIDFSGNAVNTRFQRPQSFSKGNLRCCCRQFWKNVLLGVFLSVYLCREKKMSKFYMPPCNESFLLHTVIIMISQRTQHTRNYLANETTKIYK